MIAYGIQWPSIAEDSQILRSYIIRKRILQHVDLAKSA
jgi:hypothetical protein